MNRQPRRLAAVRRIVLVAAAGVVAGAAASAQPPRTRTPEGRDWISRLAADPEGVALQHPESLHHGAVVIASGARATGQVAASGPVDVFGTVDGDVVAIDGDVVVHGGGHVTGSAVAVRGVVRLDGGRVDGEMRSLSAVAGAAASVARSPLERTRDAVSLALAWLAVLVLLGIGALIAAEPNLDHVAATIERSFGRAFWAGVGSELAIIPLCVLGVVALAITIVGLVVIPVAAVAYVAAIAGALTLGFLAASRVVGTALVRARGTPAPRAIALRSLLAGVCLFLGPWLLAACFAWAPLVAALLRVGAGALTWVAATTGLGAVVLSRAGTRRPRPVAAAGPDAAAGWQTPTPVSGVAAARRPTPVAPAGDR